MRRWHRRARQSRNRHIRSPEARMSRLRDLFRRQRRRRRKPRLQGNRRAAIYPRPLRHQQKQYTKSGTRDNIGAPRKRIRTRDNKGRQTERHNRNGRIRLLADAKCRCENGNTHGHTRIQCRTGAYNANYQQECRSRSFKLRGSRDRALKKRKRPRGW